MKNNSPVICFATYVGGGPQVLDEFVGTPCLVYEAVSSEWARELDTQRAIFRLKALDTPDTLGTPALMLETRAGKCAHFVLVDLSDPAVWRVLDVWIEQRCFVVVQHIAGNTSFNGCRLSDEDIQMLRKCRNSVGEHNPVRFGQFCASDASCLRDVRRENA